MSDYTMTPEEKSFNAKERAWVTRILEMEAKIRSEKLEYDNFLRENKELRAAIYNKNVAKNREDKLKGQRTSKERAEILSRVLKPGDLVCVKTKHGNRCAEILVTDGTGIGYLCNKTKYPRYVYNEKKKWILNPKYNPKYVGWENSTEHYSPNSVVGLFREDVNGEIILERYK